MDHYLNRTKGVQDVDDFESSTLQDYIKLFRGAADVMFRPMIEKRFCNLANQAGIRSTNGGPITQFRELFLIVKTLTEEDSMLYSSIMALTTTRSWGMDFFSQLEDKFLEEMKLKYDAPSKRKQNGNKGGRPPESCLHKMFVNIKSQFDNRLQRAYTLNQKERRKRGENELVFRYLKKRTKAKIEQDLLSTGSRRAPKNTLGMVLHLGPDLLQVSYHLAKALHQVHFFSCYKNLSRTI